MISASYFIICYLHSVGVRNNILGEIASYIHWNSDSNVTTNLKTVCS